jgi:hypothetical protein
MIQTNYLSISIFNIKFQIDTMKKDVEYRIAGNHLSVKLLIIKLTNLPCKI